MSLRSTLRAACGSLFAFGHLRCATVPSGRLFRWVKCLMGCGHWLVESPRGVTNQFYLALIGALLLQFDLGRRPSKRIWELYQWHQVGMLDDDELAQALTAQLAREEQARAKKAKAYPN